MYRIETVSTRIRRELRQIPKQDLGRIGDAIAQLAHNPVPLRAIQLEPNMYRIRVGEYRVVYKVYEDEQLVLIGRVARRNESTYRRLTDLFD